MTDLIFPRFIGQDNAAGYLDKVTEPMDLGTIKLKVERKKYKSMQEFSADVALLVSNCFAFHDINSPQYKVNP